MVSVYSTTPTKFTPISYSPEAYDDPDPEPDRLASFTSAHSRTSLQKEWATVSYRPTNEGCLMRQVAMPDFCVVCTEGLWLRLLSKVSLIDYISISSKSVINVTGSNEEPVDTVIDLLLIPLAHLRSPAGVEYLAQKGTQESYYIKWFNDGKEIETWQNATQLRGTCRDMNALEVEVKFISSEIRKDDEQYTMDRRQLSVSCEHHGETLILLFGNLLNGLRQPPD